MIRHGGVVVTPSYHRTGEGAATSTQINTFWDIPGATTIWSQGERNDRKDTRGRHGGAARVGRAGLRCRGPPGEQVLG